MCSTGAFTHTVGVSDTARRLDAVVADHVPECSRSYAATLIQSGSITIDGRLKKPSYRVKPGETIQGVLPLRTEPTCSPEPIPLDILYEDSHIIVINKPAGMVVHPAPGNYTGTLVQGLLHHCPALGGVGAEMRPGIVHRLDKDTSGVILVAKQRSVLEQLARQFKARKVKKNYTALVYGCMAADSGEISMPVGRHPVHRKKMSVTSPKGRPAKTLWQVAKRFHLATLLDVDLKTGRTHQIRVHCAAIHHPLVGDRVYAAGHGSSNVRGGAEAEMLKLLKSAPRQMLHARKLELTHPVKSEKISFAAPLPDEMRILIDRLSAMDEVFEP
jgi:23S rRNA pseudouridine1911/1915/1917 synthase